VVSNFSGGGTLMLVQVRLVRVGDKFEATSDEVDDTYDTLMM
jgi:hypothetical protein